jgi:hypothetical protein
MSKMHYQTKWKSDTSPIRKCGATTMNHEFIGKLVAFYLDLTVGKDIVTSFGSKWNTDAVCYDSNKKQGVTEESYDIA